LESFVFTGAAILEKSSAAYQQTSIAASLHSIESLDELFAVPEIAAAVSDYLSMITCAALAYQKGIMHANR
jgi:hypothetical protein